MRPTGRIVFSSGYIDDTDIWILNLDTERLTQLTFGYCRNDYPRWSPDGSKIAFISNEEDLIPSIYTINSDGSEKIRWTKGFYCQGCSWHPDGRSILFCGNPENRNEIDIFKVSHPNDKPESVLKTVGIQGDASWSPDGKSIIYTSENEDISQGPETDIFEFDISTHKTKRLTNHPTSDSMPAYSPDGSRIAFISHREGIDAEEYYEAIAEIQEAAQLSDLKRVNLLILRLKSLKNKAYDSDIWVMNRDGSDLQQLTSNSGSDTSCRWSPCGNFLCYATSKKGHSGSERIEIISSYDGEVYGLNYDRSKLLAEISQQEEKFLNKTVIQKIIPDFLEKKMVSSAVWGQERNPDWI
jgi:Tol biopolymer transport system component